MKKYFLFLSAFLLVAIIGFSQSERYMATMEKLKAGIDTTRTSDGFLQMANSFQRVAEAEKNQWLPYYYAALGNVNAAYMMSSDGSVDAAKTDPLADKADKLLTEADKLNPDNSEIYCVKKMIATLRLMGDPMSRYMTYGPAAQEALDKAKKLNPENPRPYMLEGQDKFYTPEAFGGSKEEAKVLFNKAIEKFEAFKPESSIHPTWGLEQTKYFLSIAN